MSEQMKTPAYLVLPPNGYDARICPYCAADGQVTGGMHQETDGWAIRWHTCICCGKRWPTVELYVSRKNNGSVRKGIKKCRLLALEVDAFDMDQRGPTVNVEEEDSDE